MCLWATWAFTGLFTGDLASAASAESETHAIKTSDAAIKFTIDLILVS